MYGLRYAAKNPKNPAIGWSLIQVKREDEEEREALIVEATELMKIFGSIVEKSK